MMMNQRRKLALDELRKAHLKWVEDPGDAGSALYLALKEVLGDDKHRVFLAGDPVVDPTEMREATVRLIAAPVPSTSGRAVTLPADELVYIPKTVAFALFNAGFQAGDSVQAKLLPNYRDGARNSEMPWLVAEVKL